MNKNDPRFVLDVENLNDLQLETIRNLIRRAKHAHTVDIKMRINGHEEQFQADWLKHVHEEN